MDIYLVYFPRFKNECKIYESEKNGFIKNYFKYFHMANNKNFHDISSI